MAQYGMKQKLFREIVKTYRYKRPKTNKQESSFFVQTNQLLRRTSKYYYPKCTGIKTGYLSKAAYNLVSSAEDNGRSLILVLMNCKTNKDRYADSKKIFEIAFAEPKLTQKVFRKGIQKWEFSLKDANATLQTEIEDDFFLDYYPSEKPEIKASLQRKSLELPIKKGSLVGEILLYIDGDLSDHKISLFASNELDYTKMKKMTIFWNLYGKNMIFCIASFLALSAFILWRRGR